MHEIVETDLPGIGRKSTFQTQSGDTIAIVVYHTGGRELYHFAKGELEPSTVLEFTKDEAHLIAAILFGVQFPHTVTGEE
jgi:TrkA domain protein